jgi:hypothetical protein
LEPPRLSRECLCSPRTARFDDRGLFARFGEKALSRVFIEILLEERPAQKPFTVHQVPLMQRIHNAAAFVAPQRGAGGGVRGTSPNAKSNA